MAESQMKSKRFVRTALLGGAALLGTCLITIFLYHALLTAISGGIAAERATGLAGNALMLGYSRAEGMLQISGPNVVRAASVELETQQFDQDAERIADITRKAGGFVDEIKIHRPGSSSRWLEAKLRVPANSLESVLVEVKGLGRVQLEAESGENTEEERETLRAQVDSKHSDLQRISEVIRDHRGSLGDALEAEKQLSARREELKELENHLKKMEARIEYAVVELKIFETYWAHLDWGREASLPSLHNGLIEGVEGIVTSLSLAAGLPLKYGIPLAVWVAILFWPARLVWRRWRRAAATV